MTVSNHKRVLLLINAKSRKGEEAGATAKAKLERCGFEVTWPETDASQFSDLIKANQNLIDLVIVGGGDGSIRCALKGLFETGLPLGILPLGTANNLARNLGLSTDLDEVCEVIRDGHIRTIDVGEVNGTFFFNVVGLGLSTEVNKEVPPELKKRFGALAFVMTAFKNFRRSNSFRAHVIVDGKDHVERAHQITVCNGRHFGSGLVIDPNATIDDGTLDVAVIEAQGFYASAKMFWDFIRGHGRKHPGLKRLRGKEIEIRTKKTLSIDIDGEVMTKTPARFKIHPNAIEIVAPRPVKEATQIFNTSFSQSVTEL